MIDYGEPDGGDLRSDATYYAKIDSDFPRERPLGLVRRWTVNGLNHDEAFTRNMRWEPDSYLAICEAGYEPREDVEISYDEAKRLVAQMIERIKIRDAEKAVELASYYAERPEHAP